jgi:ubiquinone/menaquinone biosynthesis C-methylase UbiE
MRIEPRAIIYNFIAGFFGFSLMWRLPRIRRELIGWAKGKTLEIGIGTGQNLKFYPRGIELFALDPDRSLLDFSLSRSKGLSLNATQGRAEQIPFGDSTFDTVVATLVFCSIPNPEVAFKEVYRVLRPNGNFLLLEHVRFRHGLAGFLQDLLTPVWKVVAGGCHLNRNPETLLKLLNFQTREARVLWRGLGRLWVIGK